MKERNPGFLNSQEQVIKNQEAPISSHINGYYKGFHIGITQRNPEMQEEIFQLIKNAKIIVDLMIKDGWKPSWNGETNKQFENNPEKSQESMRSSSEDENTPNCNLHDKKMKKRKDKEGNIFYSHAKKKDDKWEYCSGKGFPSER